MFAVLKLFWSSSVQSSDCQPIFKAILNDMNKQTVVDYYDYTIPFYKIFWHKGTNALHYGLWNRETKNLQEALLNSNKVLSDIANIKEQDTILDAGSGVGGSSLWLAKNKGSNVTGITISEKQKEKAVKYALRENLQDKTNFLVRDFLDTGFPDNHFTVVWAIESVCHAKDKSDFLKEAYRVLKPGGRLIVADGFLRRSPGANEQQLYKDFLKGFALDNLVTIDGFSTDMNKVGFSSIQVLNKTKEIEKTSEQMYRLSTRWFWLNKTLNFLHVVPQLMIDNMRTGIVQKEFFKDLGEYAIFYGEK